MEVEQFTSTRLKAIELFKSQPKGSKDTVSLDAIFISLCSQANAQATPAAPGRHGPPHAPAASSRPHRGSPKPSPP
jgi:hypothetical protein